MAIDTSYAERGPSGTATYIECLIPALRAAGVEVVELRQPVRGRRGGRNRLRSAANAALDLAWTRELLPRAAKRAGADVLHHPLPAWSPTAIPQVVTVHDVAFARLPQDFDPLWQRFALRSHRAAVAHAGAVIAVSEATRRDAIAWLRAPAELVVTAPHGPGQQLPQPGTRSAEHFLYVGDDEPRKNVAGLRAAHAAYEQAGGTLPLLLAGSAGTPAAGDELARLHARAAALVHPARDEGFGLTVLEAMAAGTPVVAVRNAGVEEVAGDAALVVEEPGLAAAMLRIEREPELRGRLAAAGLRRAAGFSWPRSAEAHIQAYTLAREPR